MQADAFFDPERAANLPPSITKFKRLLAEKARIFGGAIDRANGRFGSVWAEDLDEVLTLLCESDTALGRWIDGYASFAIDSMRRQKVFERELRYPEAAYDQVLATVYGNAAYMEECYLPGLLLSHYLWTHHFLQLQFFDHAFVSAIPSGRHQAFAEVGVGTGIYSRRMLRKRPDLTGTGYDISESSLAFAQKHLAAFGLTDRYTFCATDISSGDTGSVPLLVCVEVLEHLEDPPAFLRSLRALLQPGGRAFITAALNAANLDHIYLYRKPEEIAQQLVGAGFVIEQFFAADAYASPDPAVPVPSVAAFVVG